MSDCKHLEGCAFVTKHVEQFKPHWNEFVTYYCQGIFQDVCRRRQWYEEHGEVPDDDLMPTGSRVSATTGCAKERV